MQNMLEVYTVSFFGHRRVEHFCLAENISDLTVFWVENNSGGVSTYVYDYEICRKRKGGNGKSC